MLRFIVVLLSAAALLTQSPPALFNGRAMMHAHNAYPEKGKWGDRIERALATGATPIVIEQDVPCRPGRLGAHGRVP